MKEKFVIDTNVIMIDPYSVQRLGGTVLVTTTVLSELDKHKTDNGEKGRNIREFARLVDKQKLNNIEFIDSESYNYEIGCTNDDKIIHIAESHDAILVTNDILMSIKAKAVGIKTQRYEPVNIICDSAYSGILDSRKEINHHKEVILNPNQFHLAKDGLFIQSGNAKKRLSKDQEVWGITHRNVEQKCALHALLDDRIKLVTISGKAGTGKSQPLSEPVLTPNGWVSMGDVVPNSYVIGSDGKPKLVKSIHPQGKLDIYEVHFSDGSKTRCSEDHLWETKTCLDRSYNRNGSVKTTKEIMETIVYGKNNKKNHSIPIVKPIDFCFRELLIDPYVMGLLLGDGSLSQNTIAFTTKDEEIVSAINKSLPCDTVMVHKSKYNYTFKKEKRNNEHCSLRKAIEVYGLLGTKSNNKFIPKDYLLNSIDNRINLLQGLMDSDGTLDYRTGKNPSITTTSFQLATDIIELIRSLGGVASISDRTTQYIYLDTKKDGKESYRIQINLPENINPFKISRKSHIYKSNEKYLPTKYITDVKYIGEEDCQCIYIDSDDHLYVTKDYILTHNTLLAIAAGLKKVVQDNKYQRLLVSRPVIPMGNDIGYLPGDINEKLGPWMQPIFDNIDFLFNMEGNNKSKNYDAYKELEQTGILKVEALTYIRGRSIPEHYIIIDEAQNLTKHEVKTIISRAGDDTKIILTGDPDQIDNPKLDSINNGLTYVIEKFKDQNIAAHITLSKCERSELADIAAEIL